MNTNVFRRAVVRISALAASVAVGLTCHFLLTAGTASAVDDKTSCAEVLRISEKLNNDVDSLSEDDPGYMANAKKVFKSASISFADVAAKADDGELKNTIGKAADKMNWISSTSDKEFIAAAQDDNSDYNKAVNKLDTSCPAS